MLFKKKKEKVSTLQKQKINKNYSLLEKESPSVLDMPMAYMLKFDGICMLWFWSETLLLLFSLTNMLICMEF